MKIKLYDVRASMSVTIRTLVIAHNEDHALEQAKLLAQDGLMEELPYSGDITDWEVTPLPRSTPPKEAVS